MPEKITDKLNEQSKEMKQRQNRSVARTTPFPTQEGHRKQIGVKVCSEDFGRLVLQVPTVVGLDERQQNE
jgi:hypothetical protein